MLKMVMEDSWDFFNSEEVEPQELEILPTHKELVDPLQLDKEDLLHKAKEGQTQLELAQDKTVLEVPQEPREGEKELS